MMATVTKATILFLIVECKFKVSYHVLDSLPEFDKISTKNPGYANKMGSLTILAEKLKREGREKGTRKPENGTARTLSSLHIRLIKVHHRIGNDRQGSGFDLVEPFV